jgi:hypothetical protein
MTHQMAENYHLQYDLGLMPDSHWTSFGKYVDDFTGRRSILGRLPPPLRLVLSPLD